MHNSFRGRNHEVLIIVCIWRNLYCSGEMKRVLRMVETNNEYLQIVATTPRLHTPPPLPSNTVDSTTRGSEGVLQIRTPPIPSSKDPSSRGEILEILLGSRTMQCRSERLGTWLSLQRRFLQ